MRIILSSLQSPERYSIAPYEFWRTYFVRGLEEAGHQVLEVPEVDWVEGLVCPHDDSLKAWRAQIWERVHAFVRRELERGPIHMFLSYLFPQQVETSAIDELQRRGIPCVNFFCDNVREFRRVPREYTPFALHWVPEFEALSLYRMAGLPHIHAPMPCWIPAELRQVTKVEAEPPTFIGSFDVLRHELFANALSKGAEIILRGSGWATDVKPNEKPSLRCLVPNQLALIRSQGLRGLYYKLERRLRPLRSVTIPVGAIGSPLHGSEYFRVTREARVVIGVNRVPTMKASNRRPLTYSRLRDIEAPMLGACYLTEWTEGITALYDLGTEIETYQTVDELVYKIDELSGNSYRRTAMRKQAQRRALCNHSVARTIARICEKLGV
ncbi:MAG TPA: glycosyltransferase [Xanthobacteraceae bacterium]|nr:glycosyltransferase [Xanthobacteraceae bacterium]